MAEPRHGNSLLRGSNHHIPWYSICFLFPRVHAVLMGHLWKYRCPSMKGSRGEGPPGLLPAVFGLLGAVPIPSPAVELFYTAQAWQVAGLWSLTEQSRKGEPQRSEPYMYHGPSLLWWLWRHSNPLGYPFSHLFLPFFSGPDLPQGICTRIIIIILGLSQYICVMWKGPFQKWFMPDTLNYFIHVNLKSPFPALWGKGLTKICLF